MAKEEEGSKMMLKAGLIYTVLLSSLTTQSHGYFLFLII